MTHPKQTTSSEKDRQAEEALRNDARFDAFNLARAKAGLKLIPWADYAIRKHGLQRQLDQVTHLAAESTQPENRDNIVLFTR